MRNYIILNGISSETITGLLIQNLPPISKPKQRVNIEEIDGRSGDIVTYLGYSAYDKQFEIGLYGDYDIDDVISFFNSQGTIIFSNEEDKYYNYQIIEQIDFERLVRYRTATVKIHVQPFKFSTIETPLSYEIGENQTSIKVFNSGNYKSNPKLTVYGTGSIVFALNGTNILTINLGDEGNITIDTAELEAYKGTVLKNRLVSGDYDKFALLKGENTISWTGTVTKIEIDQYSRWI